VENGAAGLTELDVRVSLMERDAADVLKGWLQDVKSSRLNLKFKWPSLKDIKGVRTTLLKQPDCESVCLLAFEILCCGGVPTTRECRLSHALYPTTLYPTGLF
jgi:hypothetical protein